MCSNKLTGVGLLFLPFFEDGGIRLAIFRDTNLEVIFTSQLDVNNMACWKNAAPRLHTGATVHKPLRRGRVFLPSTGDGVCPKKKHFPGR